MATGTARIAFGGQAHFFDGPNMAGTLRETDFVDRDLPEHREAFHGFARLVLFALLHVCVVLSGLALAFLANVPLLGLLVGLGGTAALIAFFVVRA